MDGLADGPYVSAGSRPRGFPWPNENRSLAVMNLPLGDLSKLGQFFLMVAPAEVRCQQSTESQYGGHEGDEDSETNAELNTF